jgi:tRNA U34 5-methylaminomethyl-2-thiouridine-forming methyltransferase MnmC
MSIEIIQTSDGSHSLLNTELNETYHSHHGAVQESMHVFINQGLNFFVSTTHTNPVRIFEVGFGTGLNAFLTLQNLIKDVDIHYTSIEAFPLEESIWSVLNYASTEVEKEVFQNIHQAKWNETTSINAHFNLLKLRTTLQAIDLSNSVFDIVYFDAFAPNKQPEMWETTLLQKVVNTLTPGGVFATYCAKGQLKRDLRLLGLTVQTLSGPPGKKEMVRALKI